MRIRRVVTLATALTLLALPSGPMASAEEDGGFGITCHPDVRIELTHGQTKAKVIVTPDTRWYSLDFGAAPEDPAPDPTAEPTPDPTPEPTSDPDPTAEPMPGPIVEPTPGPSESASTVGTAELRSAVARKLRCKNNAADVVVTNTSTGERTSYRLTPGATDSRVFPHDLHGGQLVVATVEQGRGEDRAEARTDVTVPTHPRYVVANDVTDESAVVAWTRPEFDGGSAVLDYTVLLDGKTWRTVTLGSVELTGLAPDTAYLVKVTARNAKGSSDAGWTALRTDRRETVPTEPRDLTVTATTRSSLSLRWAPPASDGGRPVTGYQVSVAGQHVDVAGQAATTTTVTGLDAGTRYVVEVSAINAKGISPAATTTAWTDMVPAPNPSAPDPPRKVKAISATHDSISLRWSPPVSEGGSEITGYGIWVDGDYRGSVTGLGATVDGLQAGTKYRLAVKAISARGSSKAASIDAWTLLQPVPAPTAPSAPRDLEATGATHTTMLLDWRVPADDGGNPVTGYLVSWGAGDPISTDRTSLLVTGLKAGRQYAFVVRATNAMGASPAATVSAWTNMDPVPAPTVPSAPQSLKATRATQTAVTLVWRRPADNGGRPVTGYAVFVDEEYWDAVKGTTATITALAPGTHYGFEVRALNDLGRSEPASTTAWTAMRPVPMPTAPTAPRDLQSIGATHTSLLLDWLVPASDGGNPITGYEVTWSGGTLTTERTAVLLTDLTAGTGYAIEVRAVNAMGSSDPARIDAWTVLDPVPAPTRPGVPVGLKAVASTTTSIVVDWTAPASDGGNPVTGYAILVDGAFHDLVTATSASITGLSPGTSYRVDVEAVNAMGRSDPATVAARTADRPAPAPAPVPAPRPQPITPGGASAGTTVDIDGDPRTKSQTVTGSWPARTTIISGRRVLLERTSRLVTNAGQDIAVAISYRSPSVRSASVTLNSRRNAYYLRVVLKPGTVSGAVVLTVLAPRTTVNGVTYEALHSSKRFTVRDIRYLHR